MASRRDADRLIASGAVRVNGRVPPAAGMLIDAAHDTVTVDGRAVSVRPVQHYFAVHKPKGVLVTARDDRGRRTVFEWLAPLTAQTGRLFAVGRLDMNTTGLLLVTDDGRLANLLTHPRHEVPKEYLAVVEGTPDAAALARLREGVLLEDGPTLPADVHLLSAGDGRARLRIVIREGRNRQVRRMLEAIGHPVRELQRTRLGPIRLGGLRPGAWRELSESEVRRLREAARA